MGVGPAVRADCVSMRLMVAYLNYDFRMTPKVAVNEPAVWVGHFIRTHIPRLSGPARASCLFRN